MKLIKAEPRTYSEIGQQINIKFAFCTKKEDTLTQLFSFVKCRDFLGDCLHSRDTKTLFSIYGFTFNYTKTPLDEDATKLLVQIPEEYIKTFTKNYFYLNQIEVDQKLKPSTFTHVKNDIYYIEGDVFWQKTTQLISFYTLAIKCLAVEHNESLWDSIPNFTNEYSYINQILPELPKFLSSFKNTFKKKTYNSSGYISTERYFLHESSGIVKFLNNSYNNFEWKLNNTYYKEYLKWQKVST